MRRSSSSLAAVVACCCAVGAASPWLSGCDGSATALLITVNGRRGVQQATTLDVAITHEGSTQRLSLSPNVAGAKFFGRAGPENARLVIQADGRIGPVGVDVVARDATTRGVGSGSTTAQLVADTVVQANMTLDPFDFEVNSNGAASQVNEFFSTGPSGRQLASGSSGRFVATWRDDCRTPPCTMFARLFDDYGQPQLRSDGTSDQFVASEPTKNYDMPAVAMQPGGDFVFVFKRVTSNSAGPGDIVARSYDPTGQARTGDQPLSAGTDDTAAPDITVLSGGGYAVVWEQERKPASATMVEVMLKLLDAQGTPTGGSDTLVATFNKQTVSPTACSPPGNNCPKGAECSSGGICQAAGATPAVAAGSQPGTLMVVWRELGEIKARAYNNSNSPLGAAKPVSTGVSGRVGGIDVAGVATGYAVVFDDLAQGSIDSDGRAIWLRRFKIDGAPLDADFTLNTTTSGSQSSPAIATTVRDRALVNVLVVWTSEVSADDPAGGIRGRRLLLNGMPVGNDFAINTTRTQVQRNPSIAPHGDESFIVAFEDGSAEGQDKFGTAIRARIVYPNFAPRDGLLGALCTSTNPCAADLECVPTNSVGNRCSVTCPAAQLGGPCSKGGTCQQVSGVTRNVCFFSQP